MQGVTRARSEKYLTDIRKRYPEDFLRKVFEWARVELSPLELDKEKSIENLAERFIDENRDNPDMVSSEEIAMFFDKKTGKQKPFVHDPDDDEVGELEPADKENLHEKPPAPRIKKAPVYPDASEAKRMTSEEITKYLSFDDPLS